MTTHLASADAPAATHHGRAARIPRETLTRTEQQILDLVASGHFNQEIATRLGVVVGTVKWHLHQIFAKLGARNRTEAVARARERGALASFRP